MLQWSRTMLHSPCSGAVGAPTKPRCAPPPSDEAAPERCAAERGGVPLPVSNRQYAWPTPPTSRYRPHPPKEVPDGGSDPEAAAAPAWLRPGLGCRPGAPPPLAVGPEYPPQYVACGPSLSCPRRSPWAPFFGRLHRLTINDRRTGCGVVTSSFAGPRQEGIVNLLPGSFPLPNPEIMVRQLPARQVVRQETPGATGAQHIRRRDRHRRAAGSSRGGRTL